MGDSDLTTTQLDQITAAVREGLSKEAHDNCKFDKEDRENIHELCRILRSGGLDAMREMIMLSRQIAASKKVIWAVTVATTAGGAITLFVLGVRAWIKAAFKG